MNHFVFYSQPIRRELKTNTQNLFLKSARGCSQVMSRLEEENREFITVCDKEVCVYGGGRGNKQWDITHIG